MMFLAGFLTGCGFTTMAFWLLARAVTKPHPPSENDKLPLWDWPDGHT